MLSCEFRIKNIDEISKTHNDLKEFFKDSKFIFDKNESITEKEIERKDYNLEDIQDIEYKSEKMYYYLRTPAFKKWFGFDFDTKTDLSVDEAQSVNEQFEPKLFTEIIKGKTVGYFKNKNGEIKPLPNSSSLTNLDYLVANEIANKILYFTVESLRNETNLDVENVNLDKVYIDNVIDKFTELFSYSAASDENVREGLDILTMHKDYISDLVTSTIKDFSLKVKEVETEIQDLDDKDNSIIKKESTLVNSKEKASANIRLLLAFSIPKVKKIVDEQGKAATVLDNGNYFQGLNQFESFGRVWQIIEPALANTPSIYEGENNFKSKKETFFRILEAQVPIHEGIELLVNQFNNYSEFELNEFFKAFSKSSKNYLTNQYEVNMVDGVKTVNIKTITNSNNKPEDTSFDSWNVKMSNNFVDDSTFSIPNANKIYEQVAIDKSKGKEFDSDKVLSFLNSIGINVDYQTLYLASAHASKDLQAYSELLLSHIKDINGRSAFDKFGNAINPYMEYRNDFEELGYAQAQHDGYATENTTLGPKGLYWNYSLTTFMDNVISSTKLGDTSHLDGLDNNKWSKNSVLANKIKEGEIKLHTFLQFKKLGDKGVEETGINEHDNIILQVNRVLKNKIYNLFSPADKTTTFLMSGFDFTSTVNENEWVDKFVQYAKDENAIVTELGKENYTLLNGELNDSDFNEDGNINDVENLEEKIKNYIDSLVNEIITEYKLLEEGRKESFFDSAILKEYNGNVEVMLKDYVVNSQVALIEASKVFTGYAGYYKNVADFTKRVPATQTDGVPLALTINDPLYFNVAVVDAIEDVKSIMGSTKNIDAVFNATKKYNPNITRKQVETSLNYYNNVNIGDAQAWITLDRAKFIITKAGKWNSAVSKVFQKAENGEILSEADSKLLSLQPLKGVHFELINGKPYYLKYSQAILIPSMIKGTPLEKMNEAMLKDKDNIIDELITQDGVKTGNDLRTRIHNDSGTLVDKIVLKPVKLSNRYWKLQQELPSKKIKKGKLASQIQKNIFADLVEVLNNAPDSPIFNGKTAAQVIAEIKSITSDLLNDSNDKLLDKLGVTFDDNFKLDKLTEKGLSEIKNIILSQLGANKSASVIANIKKGITLHSSGSSLDFSPTVKNRVQNVLSSFFKKRQVEIEINQAALIQISNFGISNVKSSFGLTDISKKGIIFLKDIDELNGPTLNEDGTLNKGEILIPSWLFEKAYPNFRSYKKEVRDDILKNLDPRIFEVLGYRIPNQGLSSNDALTVVGLLPPGAGDSVVIYNGITTKTGSDFDIDKMYMILPNVDIKYTPEFYKKAKKFILNRKKSFFDEGTINELTDILEEYGIPESQEEIYKAISKEDLNEELENEKDVVINEIINKLVKIPGNGLHDDFVNREGTEGLPKLVYATKGKDGKQNRLLELYTDVLSAESNYYNVVKPIDESTKVIEKVITDNITETNKKLDIYSPVAQSKKRTGLLKGKQGVGADANQLVNHPLTQLSDLSLFGTTVYKLDKVYDLNGKHKITEILSGFLNAFVDIAKDDWVLQGNVNATTFSALALALRSGVPIKDIIDLLMSPQVKEYIENESKISSKFLPESEKIEPAPIKKEVLDTIVEQFVRTGKLASPTYALNVFLRLKSDGQMLTKLIQASQFEVNGSGNNSAKLMTTMFKVQSLFEVEDKKFNKKGISDYFSQNGILGTRLKNNILGRYEVERQLFFELDLINEVRSAVSVFDPNKLTDEEFVENLLSSLNALVYNDLFSQLIPNSDTLFTKEWNNKFNDIKSKYPDNEMLRHISTKSTKDLEFLNMNTIRNMPKPLKDQMMSDFRDLLITEPQFGEELIAKSFYQSGFKKGLSTFYEFIPTEFFEDYRETISNSIRNLKSSFSSTELALHHALNNMDSVYNLKKAEVESKFISKDLGIRKYQNEIYIPVRAVMGGFQYKKLKDLKQKITVLGSTKYSFNNKFDLNDLAFLENLKLDQDVLANLSILLKGELVSKPKAKPVLNEEVSEEVIEDIEYEDATLQLDNTQSVINIYAGDNQNADLSNFAIRPFTINVETESGGKQYTFQSVEQGFHFYKALTANNPTQGAEILKTTNGGKLKSLTNRSNLPMTNDQVKEWDSVSKSTMLNLMYDSFNQNPNATEKLLATGNATITHTQDNTRWKKDFPDVVMTVRNMLREEQPNNTQPNTLEQLSLFETTSETQTLKDLKKDFNIYRSFLNQEGIYNMEDLDNASEEKLKELLDKICKS